MKPCPALWETPSINWNGDVTVCCTDILFKLKIGNINKNTLKELWNSPIMTEFRIKHIKGETKDIPVCNECTGMEPRDKEQFLEKIALWLIEIKKPELIKEARERI
jgi:radical SAM protein with 4Fe4S-binding SPASM domain